MLSIELFICVYGGRNPEQAHPSGLERENGGRERHVCHYVTGRVTSHRMHYMEDTQLI